MIDEPDTPEDFDKVATSRRRFVKYLVALPFAAPALVAAAASTQASETTTTPPPHPGLHHHQRPEEFQVETTEIV